MPLALSPRSIRRLRACWAVQALVGCAVTPRMCTALVSISITNSTYTRRSSTVSTCRKSQARMPDAWAARTAARSATSAAARDRGQRQPGSVGSSPPPPGTQARQLALDAPVPPARVLQRQLLHQCPRLGWDRRPAQGIRIGPFPLDQAAVPGQQCARRHDPVQPQAPRQHPGQGGEHGTVSPVRPRTRDLPAQHRHFVPQHEDLRVLGGVTCAPRAPASRTPGPWDR